MSGLSTAINAAAGAINGYRNQSYVQNQQDYLAQARANDELHMQAQAQTYQPQAAAQIAQSGLSAAQSNAQAALVPQQQQLAQTNLGTQQSAADAALARQPTLNQTADNQAVVQQGTTGAQAQMLPQTVTDMRLQQLSQDQQFHLGAISGLYTAMRGGAQSARDYVQKVADAGGYPGLQGKQIGQVGLSADGQNFVAQDAQGNELFQLPTQTIQQAWSLQNPAKMITAKPGETVYATRGSNIVSATTAPVPEAYSQQHDSALVKDAKWISANVTNGDNAKALQIARQATSMSREQFVATIMGNPAINTNLDHPEQAAQQFGAIYDRLRAQSAPGLSNAPASNTSGNQIIDSLIGGANPSGTASNPFAPDPQ